MEKVSDLFGISPATVSKYCDGVEVPAEVRERALADNSNGSLVQTSDTENSDDRGYDEDEGFGRPQQPRLSYEISADRPMLVEPNGVREGNQHPPAMSNLSSRDDWDEIVAMIRSASWTARYRGSAADFYTERIVPDLEIADLVKTYVGSNDPEVLREALSIVWKKSLAYDRIQKDTGLANGGERPSPKTESLQN